MHALLLLGVLLVLGFFAGIEIAFVSANKLAVELKKKQGRRSAIILSALLDKPYTFVGVCITAYTLCIAVYGLIVTRLTAPFWSLTGIDRLEGWYMIRAVAEILLAVLLVLLFEFLFRAIFRAKSDTLLSFFAGFMNTLHNLLKPLVVGMVDVSAWLLKYLLNIKMESLAKPFSRIDLEHYYQQTKEADDDGQELNQELFENALSISGVKVRNCLIPRTEIVGVPLQATVSEALKLMLETRLSKIVVYDGTIDTIAGYIHQLDMLKQPAGITDILLPIPTIPESMLVTDLISKFSAERKSIAWVIDEFGGTAGIVTMEDLLEEIFGEIKDEFDTDEVTDEKISETAWLLDGRNELTELTHKYGIVLPDISAAETLSGYIIRNHGSLPREKAAVIVGNFKFEVLKMGHNRVEKVKLELL